MVHKYSTCKNSFRSTSLMLVATIVSLSTDKQKKNKIVETQLRRRRSSSQMYKKNALSVEFQVSFRENHRTLCRLVCVYIYIRDWVCLGETGEKIHIFVRFFQIPNATNSNTQSTYKLKLYKHPLKQRIDDVPVCVTSPEGR